MARPREHDERTSVALLDVAERLASEGGMEAVSVRRVAHEAGATTRAVYSLFGSKDGLVVALGARAFNLLDAGVSAMPVTDDPVGDLVAAGAVVFRHFALGRPALFQIGIQHVTVSPEVAARFRGAADQALAGLHGRIRRLRDVGRLGSRSVSDAACEFHALCEGLAAFESRCLAPPTDIERIWRDAITALVAGWAVT